MNNLNSVDAIRRRYMKKHGPPTPSTNSLIGWLFEFPGTVDSGSPTRCRRPPIGNDDLARVRSEFQENGTNFPKVASDELGISTITNALEKNQNVPGQDVFSATTPPGRVSISTRICTDCL